ncbi:EpsI family protein [Rhodanobacter sp. AS-Z3]|uniref:exosortase A n=1 Tax=Rhodanobacter sp. AS-Z3 TaxID=3031330 RepID=UPI00247AD969|nr:exosortase A [Rhodanobacter sp. AS-Z3]WEN15379.1 EpsI family protein [Rhodanobacter sp. AS-Z3]
MNHVPPDNAARTTGISGWTLATVAFGLAVAVLLFCYWQAVVSLVSVWDHDGTYQYAFLIPPLSLWVAFDLRGKVRAHPPMPSAWGLLAVAGLVFVWYAGHLLDVNLLQHVAIVALIPALVLGCWGWRALWVLAFPLAYLVVFAVPWGDGLVGPLQDITAHFAVHALGLTGTPALLNGREITTPAATWMVADACSGVKFFIACGALGCLYAYLMYQRWRKRVVFVLLAAIVPIIANGLRVYFTILIGDTWGLHYATGLDHLIFGWQFFGTVLVLLLLVGWFFRDPVDAREPASANDSRPTGPRMTVWPAVIVLLIIGPVLAASVSLPTPVGELQVTAPNLAGWSAAQAAADNWHPNFSGAAGQVKAAYRANTGDQVVELFHAVYTGKPRRGHTLITFENQLFDSTRAHILSSASRPILLADGRALTAGELRLSGETDSRLVWFWYCVDQRCTRSPMVTKLLQAWDVLRGDVPQSSVWALSSSVGAGGVERVQANLRAFAQALPAQTMVEPQTTHAPAAAENKP